MYNRKGIDIPQVEANMKAGAISGVSIAKKSAEGKPVSIALGTERGSQIPVMSETIFGAASLSKPVFAYLVLKLIEANKDNKHDSSDWLGKFNQPFDIDTLLKDILPNEELSKLDEKISKESNQPVDVNRKRGELFTAKMILSHQTGLNIGNLKFDFEPGSGNCGYSGVPFNYLQNVIEKLTGQPLEVLAKKFVFEPLGMTHSSFEGCSILPMLDNPIGKMISTSPMYVISPTGLYYVNDPYKPISLDNLVTADTIKVSALWKSLVHHPLEQHRLRPEEQKEITEITGHYNARGVNSLHTTANDYAIFCSAWLKDKSEALQAAFLPQVFMMKDGVINDKGEPSCNKISEEVLKKIAYGLGWELQTDENGVPTMAYHTGDMNEWRATAALNLQDRSVTVYFANSHNGFILQDQIVSPNGELETALNFFRKYPFARTIEELQADWRETPSWGTRHEFPECKSANSRGVIIGSKRSSDYPLATQSNMADAANRMNSTPNPESDNIQSSKTSSPFATPKLKPPGYR